MELVNPIRNSTDVFIFYAFSLACIVVPENVGQLSRDGLEVF